MRLPIVFLFTCVFATSTFASNHVEIKFRKATTFDNDVVYCPKSMKSRRGKYERYCKQNNKAQGDSVCVLATDPWIEFEAVGKKASKFKITAKNPAELKCNSSNFRFVHKCKVKLPAGTDELSYTISTKGCDFDPRIIISNEKLYSIDN